MRKDFLVGGTQEGLAAEVIGFDKAVMQVAAVTGTKKPLVRIFLADGLF